MNEPQEVPPEPAKLEPVNLEPTKPSSTLKTDKEEAFDRTTVIAFGLLFVLPAVIILFTVVFFLPYIINSLTADPSGVIAPAPNLPPR